MRLMRRYAMFSAAVFFFDALMRRAAAGGEKIWQARDGYAYVAVTLPAIRYAMSSISATFLLHITRPIRRGVISFPLT